jgi:hypothetical protein
VVAANPLAITGDQIATLYGDRDISMFRPVVQPGQAITGATPAQLIDPATGAPVFLRDPNDPYSFTYDVTGTPAISGTLEQQAALYRPMVQKGAFGTIGGDLLDAVKDPYFHKFLAAAAAMAGAAYAFPATAGGAAGASLANPLAGDIAAMIAADQAALGAGGLGAVGAVANPLAGDIAAMIAADQAALGAAGAGVGGLGSLGSTAAQAVGGLGGAGATGAAGVAGAAGSLGSTGASAAGSVLGDLALGDIAKGALAAGGLAAASALAPKQEAAANNSLTAEQLKAIVDAIPSAMGTYLANAQNAGQYASNVPSMVNLFPGFSLPTTGQFGAGRFGAGYAPVAPTGLV